MKNKDRAGSSKHALILGASSGIGAAAATLLAKSGFDIVGVHLDLRARFDEIAALVASLEKHGTTVRFYNKNAADHRTRSAILDGLREDNASVSLLLHSLAFGTLKPFVGATDDRIDKRALQMTMDVMAHSLVYWTQDLLDRELFAPAARIVALTSAGSATCWPSYGAVGAAKSALENHCRQLAFELAPFGLTVNALQAGITDTPALRKIPSSDQMLAAAKERHPAGRITTPHNVAQAVLMLCQPQADWITGNVIAVDGGERLVG
jgi:enoyl-[acyl-carrier protein] reductase III